MALDKKPIEDAFNRLATHLHLWMTGPQRGQVEKDRWLLTLRSFREMDRVLGQYTFQRRGFLVDKKEE